MPMPRRPMGQIPYPVPETPPVSGVNMGFADVPSNLGAYLSGAPAPDKIQSLGMNVSMPTAPRQAMLPRPTGGGGGAPTIPVSQDLIDPNVPNTLGQTSGSSIKDTALGFLKGLGGMLAESGYAMAHRSGGNADDYKSHWNEDVYTGNPNSDFSRQSQDYMAKTYPTHFDTPEQKARLSNLSGDEIRGLNPMYNQSQYLDYLRGASQMKNDVAMARINQPKAVRVSGGGTGGGKLPIALENELAKKRAAASNLNALLGSFNPENQPSYLGSRTMGLREKLSSVTPFDMENQGSKSFEQQHNRAVESYLLAMTGQAASDPSYQRLLAQVPRTYDKNYQQNMKNWVDQIEREYGAVSRGKRDLYQDLPQSSASPQGGGDSGVIDYTQFRRK